MSAVVLGPFFHGYTQSVARAFEILGHRVCTVQWSDFAEPVEPSGAIAKLRFQIQSKLFSGAMVTGNIARLRRKVLQSVQQFRPRYILCIKPWWLEEEILDQVRSACPACKIGVWMMDSVTTAPAVAALAKRLDHLFLFEPSETGSIAASDRVSFLPLAFDHERYARGATCGESLDLFFCGAMAFGCRLSWAREVAGMALQHGWSLQLAGSWWTLSRPDRYFRTRTMPGPVWRYVRNAELSHAELNARYCESRVSLNVHHEQSVQGLNMRTFEVTGAGGVLLTDYKEALRDLFAPGTDLETYASFEELREKAGFLLRNQAARDRMRKNAREAAAARHTFVHRARTIIERLDLGS